MIGREERMVVWGGAVWVLLGLASAPSALAVPGGSSAWLSWDAAGELRDLAQPLGEWPRVASGDEAGEVAGPCLRAPIYLTLTHPAPLDSLRFFLRWASADSSATVAFIGWSSAEGGDRSASRAAQIAAERAADAMRLEPLPLRVTRGLLARVCAEQSSGANTYQLAGELQICHGSSFRIEAAGLIAWPRGGEMQQFGAPTISLGDGWRLKFPPLITEVVGRLNKRFLGSRLIIRGIDLDRLVGLSLIDMAGATILPTSVDRISDGRIEVEFSNGAVAAGRCMLEYRGPDGRIIRLPEAVWAEYVEEQAPGDTNRGAKPGAPN